MMEQRRFKFQQALFFNALAIYGHDVAIPLAKQHQTCNMILCIRIYAYVRIGPGDPKIHQDRSREKTYFLGPKT